MGLESIETPYPIEGTVVPRDGGYGATLDAESEWLTHREGPDILQNAVDRARSRHGNGTPVDVVWNEDGSFDLKGPADEGGDD